MAFSMAAQVSFHMLNIPDVSDDRTRHETERHDAHVDAQRRAIESAYVSESARCNGDVRTFNVTIASPVTAEIEEALVRRGWMVSPTREISGDYTLRISRAVDRTPIMALVSALLGTPPSTAPPTTTPTAAAAAVVPETGASGADSAAAPPSAQAVAPPSAESVSGMMLFMMLSGMGGGLGTAISNEPCSCTFCQFQRQAAAPTQTTPPRASEPRAVI